MAFTEEDVRKARRFGKFLVDKARMDLSIPESIELNQLLVWYNEAVAKIEAHIMELKAIHKPPTEGSS
jgi:hypothetical protein